MSSEVISRLRRKGKQSVALVSEDLGRNVLRQAKHVIIPVIGIVVFWKLLALFINNPVALPHPEPTFVQTYEVLVEPDFREMRGLDHLWATFRRAIVVSTLAMALSVTMGVLMSTNDFIEESLSSVLPFWMTTPTVVIILLTMTWFNFSETSIAVAVMVAATPFATVNMWEGAQDVDIDLVTMAHSFDATKKMIWRHIFIPHLLPYLFGSYRYILGMVFKIVVLAEVFGMNEGIGAQFRYYFQRGEMIMMFAYLLLFIAVVLTIEYGVLKPLEEYLFRWRD